MSDASRYGGADLHNNPQIGMASGIPNAGLLVKKFTTEGGKYAYDANTGGLLKLDEITYELLDYFTTRPRHEILAMFAARFPQDHIASALSRLEKLNTRCGVFRPVNITSRLASTAFVDQNWQRMSGTFDQLTLGVTEKCNMRCKYCVFSGGYQNERVHGQSTMSWEVARKAIDYFLGNPAHQRINQHISFYGGEPTTNIGLIRRCVRYANSKDSTTTFGMTTNGTLLSKSVQAFLMRHDFRILVSLDGPRDVHDQYRLFRGGKGSFETILQNLRALKEFAPEYYRKNVSFQCTASPDTDYPRVLQFFIDSSDLIQPDKVNFGWVAPGHKAHFARFVNLQTDNGIELLEKLFLRKVVDEQLSDSEGILMRQLFQRPYLTLHRRPRNLNGWGETFHAMATCFPGNYKLFVRSDGTLFICEKCNDALEIGDVDQGLDGKRICEIYRAYHDLYNNECRKCWALRFCTRCYASDTRETGVFDASLDPRRCEGERLYWTDKLRKYAATKEQNPHAFDFLDNVVIVTGRIPLLDFELTDAMSGPEVT